HVPLAEEGAERGAELLALPEVADVVRGARLETAEARLAELVLAGAPELDASPALGLGQPRPSHRGQEHAVERVVTAMVAEDLGLRSLDRGTAALEPGRQPIERGQDLAVHREPVDGREDGDAEVAQPRVARRWDLQSPGEVFARVGPGEDVERPLEVLGAPRERPLHAHRAGGVR